MKKENKKNDALLHRFLDPAIKDAELYGDLMGNLDKTQKEKQEEYEINKEEFKETLDKKLAEAEAKY